MRKTSFLIGILLIVSMILSACGLSLRKSGVVKIGWVDTPDSFNPGLATSDESFRIFDLVYDTLYKLNINQEYELELAESATLSPDGKEWKFKIRDGVTFHDGEPLTADDVVYSINFYKDHPEEFPYISGFTSYFEKVKKSTPSSNEVIITLTQPVANMENKLSYLYVLPKHIWTGNISTETNNMNFLRFIVPDYWTSADEKAALTYLNLDMIGSGPFKMVEYQPGALIKLEAMKDHFYYKPKVDGIEIIIYKNPSDMVQALSRGEVDMISSVPFAAVAALQQMPNIQIADGPSLAPHISDIIINQISASDCPVDKGWVCTGHPALRDRNVRVALAYAVDKQRIIDDVMLGLATPGLTLVPKGLGKFYNSGVFEYTYNVNQANAFLDAAKYLDTNGDGIREMPDGSRDLDFRLGWPTNIPTAEHEAELLKFMWSQIGVVVELTPIDPALLNSRCCPTFDYDIMIGERVSNPDPAVTLGTEYSGNIDTGLNETGYSDAPYDQLYTRQLVKLDQVDRLNTILLMQQTLYTDVVYIVPFYTNAVQAYRTDTFADWPFNTANLSLENPFSLTAISPIAGQ